MPEFTRDLEEWEASCGAGELGAPVAAGEHVIALPEDQHEALLPFPHELRRAGRLDGKRLVVSPRRALTHAVRQVVDVPLLRPPPAEPAGRRVGLICGRCDKVVSPILHEIYGFQGRVEIEELPCRDVGDVRNELPAFVEGVDIVVVLAHGEPDRDRGATDTASITLLFDDGSMHAREISRMLERARRPRAVILLHCHGAAMGPGDLSSTLSALAAGGKYVAGSPWLLGGEDARRFIGGVLRALGQGRSIEQALRAGRHATTGWPLPIIAQCSRTALHSKLTAPVVYLPALPARARPDGAAPEGRGRGVFSFLPLAGALVPDSPSGRRPSGLQAARNRTMKDDGR